MLSLVGPLPAETFSSIVYPGPDGKLTYAGYANEGQASTGNRMIDFSHAGYAGGGVAIPWVPVEVTVDPLPGNDDDHARIQAAIDTLSTLPLSPAGFRGTLLLKAGTYHVSETLHVTTSGVIIRGEGQHSGGTVIKFTATVQDNLFDFAGSSGWTKISGTESAITDTLVPSGATSFEVSSTAGFSVGDRLMINRTPNQAWIDLLDMAQWGWTTAAYTSDMPRIITGIDGNNITVDAPLVHAIETQYGGGEVYRYHFDGAIRQVGIERIRLESAFTSNTDEDHGWSAVLFKRAKNAWARQVTAKYFGYSCVDIRDDSQFVTVEDCAQLDPKSIITGSRRYSFRIDDSSFILFQRCYTEKGRHDYVTQSNTAGPNVFVDSLAETTYSDIGPHHRYSEGILFDNIKGGPINVQNRTSSGTGHGWAGSQTVFWNCNASSLICDAPKAAMNFAIGCIGTKRQGAAAPDEAFGIWESEQVPVTPRSLYYTQLADRLGINALRNVTTFAQWQGTIWNDLSVWHGDAQAPSLPELSPLRVELGDDFSTTATSLELHALVRHPLPNNFPTTTTGWTQLSGTDSATFDQTSAALTHLTFPGPGTYELAYSVSQQDDRDPGNIINHSGTDSIVITITPPPDATGTLVSADSIIGEGQANTPTPGYYPDAESNTVGTGGSALDDNRSDRNVVLGFALPTLPVGETIDSVDLLYEISGARDSTGAGNLPNLQIHLLNTVDADASGTTFFFHGSSDSSPDVVLLETTFVSISGTSQNGFSDDAEDQKTTLAGAALSLFQSFYGDDHIPDQPEVFFRFNLDQDPSLSTLRRYSIDLALDESRVEIETSPISGSYLEWISGFPTVGTELGFNDDPDGDGHSNGLENFFGTDPSVTDAKGLTAAAVTTTGGSNTFTFTHPVSLNPANDLDSYLEWSTDLLSFQTDGATNATATTVNFASQPNTPSPGITTVTATITGTVPEQLFVRVGVVQN